MPRTSSYAVAWRWAYEPVNHRHVDHVNAINVTNAQRQLSVKLHEEYEFGPADLIVLEIFKSDPPKG